MNIFHSPEETIIEHPSDNELSLDDYCLLETFSYLFKVDLCATKDCCWCFSRRACENVGKYVFNLNFLSTRQFLRSEN